MSEPDAPADLEQRRRSLKIGGYRRHIFLCTHGDCAPAAPAEHPLVWGSMRWAIQAENHDGRCSMHPTRGGAVPASQTSPAAAAVHTRQRLAYRLLCESSAELSRLRRVRGAYRRTWRRIAGARRRLALAAALLGVPLAGAAGASAPSFVSPFLIPVVEGRASPAFADIDGDGDLDSFVGNSFFENTGTADAPAFAAPSTNPFGLANTGPFNHPAFVDIDGDGDLDAFAGDSFLGPPGCTPPYCGTFGRTIYFENTGTAGAPAFAASSGNPFGLADVVGVASPAFADIDGDGDLDAFVGEGPGSTIFFANTGTAIAPAFAAPSTNSFGLAYVDGVASPAFADIDGDGDLDAFVGDASGSTIFFANTGTAIAPAFATPSTNPFGLADAEHLLSSPALADLDGDGDLDAFVGDRQGDTIFFENTGTAGAPAFTASSGNPFGLEDVGYRASPTFADIDGDGDLDAFVGTGFLVGCTPYCNTYGRTIYFENTGTANAPAFAAPSTNPFGLADVGYRAFPTFADIDGDGDLDAFVGEEYGHTSFFANTGTANAPAFAAPSTNPFGLVDVGRPSAFADIDGDGDLDAFVGNYFFENTGTAIAPAFAAPSTNPFGLASVALGASPTVTDLDGDNDLDAFVGNKDGNTIFFENTGTAIAPAFAAPSTNPFGLADVGGFASPAFADLDGDNDLDAFAGNNLGITNFFENVEPGPGTCSDGIDNDSDGAIDYPSDPGCAGSADTSERGADVCDNGADDDGNGLSDFPEDPNCQSAQDHSEWTLLGPSCASSQLHALADLCSAQLRCHAQEMKSHSGRLDRCLSESEDKLSSALAKGAAASVKAGDVCPTDQAAASASALEASAMVLAADVLEGADPSNRSGATLQAALTWGAGVLCGSDLGTLGREIQKPSADGGDAALLASRERFLGSAGKAIQKAEKRGVSYDGPAPNAIADALRALSEELADQLSP